MPSVPTKCGLQAQGLGFQCGRHSLQLTFVFSPRGNNRTSEQPPGPSLAEQRTWHYPFALAICSAHFGTERGLRGKAKKPTVHIHPRPWPPAPARPDQWSPFRTPARPHPFSGFGWRRVPRTRAESAGVGRPLPLLPGVGRSWVAAAATRARPLPSTLSYEPTPGTELR